MIRVIYNPVAGPKAVRRMSRVRKLLAGADLPFDEKVTAGPGDAVLLAREAAHEGVPTVLAVGGDGTINEVANGLAGSRTRLAVVPHGTGNVFAAEVGLPDSIEGCLALLREGETIDVRLARAGERHFLLLASAGFDAEVVAGMDFRRKNALGIAAYVLAGARHLLREPPTLWLEFPGRERVEAQAVLVCRGRKYGGGVLVAPGASLREDTLHVIALTKAGRWPIVRFAVDSLRGRSERSRDVLRREAASLLIRCRLPSAAQVDGDYLGPLPVRIEMTEVRLRVVVPPAYGK